MLTEFEVRQRVREIHAAPIAPMRKARMLLKLGRSLRSQFRLLSQSKAQIARSADKNASACLSRITLRTKLLHEDVREQALWELREGRNRPFNLN